MDAAINHVHDGSAHEPVSGMSCCVNVGDTERLISAGVGGALLVGALGRLNSFSGWMLALAGGSLLYRGASGHCSAYQALGINTAERGPATAVPAKQGEKVEHSIFINRSPREIYDFWRQLDTLPRFMNHLVSVECRGEDVSHWVAKGPLGTNVHWDAEIYGDRPGEMIAWRSVAGSQIDTAGSVHFVGSSDGRGTQVRVSLKYDPPAGELGIAVAKLLGTSPRQQIAEDLRRLKQLLEAGQAPTPARQGTTTSVERPRPVGAVVDKASDESFPASDPPGWNSTSVG